MSASSIVNNDSGYFKLDADDLKFFQAETGIQDEQELKNHIIGVSERAYKVFPYPCIRRFGFIVCKVAKYPFYDQVLQLGRERPEGIFLDLGCCFGNDIRKVIADGWSKDHAVGADLHPEFWGLGHELFRSTPETFTVPFVPGDIFVDATLDSSVDPLPFPPALVQSELNSLTPLKGHVSAIHSSSFFHLFSESVQKDLAYRINSLLSPEPGSIVFGSHVGATGDNQEGSGERELGEPKYKHSAQSWKRLWEEVCGVGKVEVQCSYETFPRHVTDEEARAMGTVPGVGGTQTKLVWIVRRV